MKNKIYRIYVGTEDIDTVINTVNAHFSAYTLLRATGAWQSVTEASLVIELIGLDTGDLASDLFRLKVVNLAQELRDTLNQVCILVTITPTEALFL